MYNDIFSNDLAMGEAESFSDSNSKDDMLALLCFQTLNKQNKKKEKANKEEQARKEREAIKRKQMEERGLIKKAEEVVETVKEVTTRTVSGLRLRMNILKIMREKKSYSYVTYNNGKVSENTLDVASNTIKEISAMTTNRIVLAADNAIFNRSMFPDTS